MPSVSDPSGRPWASWQRPRKSAFSLRLTIQAPSVWRGAARCTPSTAPGCASRCAILCGTRARSCRAAAATLHAPPLLLRHAPIPHQLPLLRGCPRARVPLLKRRLRSSRCKCACTTWTDMHARPCMTRCFFSPSVLSWQVLWKYLTDSAASPLQKEFVECEEPLCSDIGPCAACLELSTPRPP